jgi:hypothetical protein
MRDNVPRKLIVIVSLLRAPSLAWADPKQDALGAFQVFLDVRDKADLSLMPSVFTPEVLFWGTTMVDVRVGHAAVTTSFTPGLAAAPAQPNR